MIASYSPAAPQSNETVVPSPRPADALGIALRDVFAPPVLPRDWLTLLRRLDRVG